MFKINNLSKSELYKQMNTGTLSHLKFFSLISSEYIIAHIGKKSCLLHKTEWEYFKLIDILRLNICIDEMKLCHKIQIHIKK